MIIEISIAVIALAFAALVIYLITLIKSIRALLGQVNQTLVHVRTQLGDIGGEAKKVIEHTNHMTADLQGKLECLNSLFRTVDNVGNFLEHKTSSLTHETQEPVVHHVKRDSITHSSTSAHAEKPAGELNKMADVLELIGVSIRLWQNLKKRR